MFWIRQAMQRGLASQSRTIRIPVHIGRRERKMERAERELAARLGPEPTDEELAEAAELTLKQLQDTRDVTRTITSLERGVGEAGETELRELLPSVDLGPEEVEIGLRQGAVERLPEPERDVIHLRYGIDTDEPTQLGEASRRLGMSPESVPRLERAALRRLAENREVAALAEAA
jgi:RNA polymerase primary sigma factor